MNEVVDANIERLDIDALRLEIGEGATSIRLPLLERVIELFPIRRDFSK